MLPDFCHDSSKAAANFSLARHFTALLSSCTLSLSSKITPRYFTASAGTKFHEYILLIKILGSKMTAELFVLQYINISKTVHTNTRERVYNPSEPKKLSIFCCF